MGYKTVRFEEFDERVQGYWHPSDFSGAVSGDVARFTASGGFLRLVFDDATYVLTGVDHAGPTGQVTPIWSSAEDPATALSSAQRARRAESAPQSFADMWQTYNGWNDYLAYAQERYISENTNFLVAVEAYRQAPSATAQAELEEHYITEGSPEQVNIDSGSVDAIRNRDGEGAGDVFDAAQREIMALLSSDFAKFLEWYLAQPAV
jgi:hypothetical protein